MEAWDEYYHSMHGALNEAIHVYIESGLAFWKAEHGIKKNPCTVFEMGFGTGLNALLSLEYAAANDFTILYETLEPFPLALQEVQELNFDSLPTLQNSKESLRKLHLAPWESSVQISSTFSLIKHKILLEKFIPQRQYDVIYYDAFGFRVQPEMWSEDTLRPLVNAMNPIGVLVTYSAKGSVRRALEALGLDVFRIEGPPGKREMLRAIRL